MLKDKDPQVLLTTPPFHSVRWEVCWASPISLVERFGLAPVGAGTSFPPPNLQTFRWIEQRKKVTCRRQGNFLSPLSKCRRSLVSPQHPGDLFSVGSPSG